MANPAKQKGTAWERFIAKEYERQSGKPAKRIYWTQGATSGLLADVVADSARSWYIEGKSYRTVHGRDIAAWLAKASKRAFEHGRRPVLHIKLTNRGAFTVLPFELGVAATIALDKAGEGMIK